MHPQLNLKWPHIIAHGGVVAVWLPLIHKNEVTKLFSILTNGSNSHFMGHTIDIFFMLEHRSMSPYL
ncbi:MAG: hypothetical protein CM15mP117_18160 [Alphaproteobacteria bacterium]|nr:MAG: hypothetical protein CM15mP117_18160 [Alphaproteobacteria bacterium]